ncbi:D-sedoheptulose 7-phosphate isomerase [Akkermansiaceae bacterium]|nr:D-sedoheptulose 7-phosphate isomerase [Akkermansiaceae bacterium]
MADIDEIRNIVKESLDVKQALFSDENLLHTTEKVVGKFIGCFKADGKILFCGNGGSAADAQHLAAELSGRFYFDREPLFAEALHVNTSYLTAVANDYSYDEIYSRLVKAKARKGDIFVGISTSGDSENVVRAMLQARKQGAITIGMTGASGGAMSGVSDILLKVPSDDTPRIQECHILLGHIICQLTEKGMFA